MYITFTTEKRESPIRRDRRETLTKVAERAFGEVSCFSMQAGGATRRPESRQAKLHFTTPAFLHCTHQITTLQCTTLQLGQTRVCQTGRLTSRKDKFAAALAAAAADPLLSQSGRYLQHMKCRHLGHNAQCKSCNGERELGILRFQDHFELKCHFHFLINWLLLQVQRGAAELNLDLDEVALSWSATFTF